MLFTRCDGKILLLNLHCQLQMFCIEFCKAILQVGLEVIYSQLSDVELDRTVGCFVPCFSASVARERKWLCFLTSINIHQNRVSGGWSMLVIHAPLWSLKSNSVEGGWMGRRWSNTRSAVGRLESFIGGSVLVNGPGCSVQSVGTMSEGCPEGMVAIAF